MAKQKRHANLEEGTFRSSSKGFGFVRLLRADAEDIFINPTRTSGAMHGDRVMVRYRRGPRGYEGEVHRIMERGHETIVGIVQNRKWGAGYEVVPDDPRFGKAILLAEGHKLKGKVGEKVVVKITRFSSGRSRFHFPEGKVIEVLGDPRGPGVAIVSIIRMHGLREAFSPAVLEEAEHVARAVSPAEMKDRKDLRGGTIVTIDGDDAKDFDDAVSIERTVKGYRLGVHIADVSHYVKSGSILDREAYDRGTSVYLVDRVLPMLPPVLSNGMCSLKQGENRLTMSALMEFDDQGRLMRYDLCESVITVTRRLTYTVAQRTLDGMESSHPELALMAELAHRLRARRIEAGALDFDLPESTVILDAKGRARAIVKIQRTFSHRLIEEFMLAANECVATHLSRLHAPLLYRIHEPPNVEDLKEFYAIASGLGYHLPSGQRVSHRLLQDVLAKVRGRPVEYLVNKLLLQAMKLAVYAPVNKGHFGLAKAYYTHFTSPIRRYPDLEVHRILRDTWQSARDPRRWEIRKASLAETGRHTSERERTAESADDESVKVKKLEYLHSHMGRVYPGIISGVQPFGIFVELQEFLIDGLVPVQQLPGDRYFTYDENRRALVGGGKKSRYSLGDLIMVRIDRVDPVQRRLDLSVMTGTA